MSDEMAAAHARDYHDQRQMRELRDAISAFLREPPSRCHRSTLEFLRSSLAGLRADCEHIVAVWD